MIQSLSGRKKVATQLIGTVRGGRGQRWLRLCGGARLGGSLKVYLDGFCATEERTISSTVCQQKSELLRQCLWW